VKIGGERAYKRARRGEDFEMPERIVTVIRFDELWREDPAKDGALGGIDVPSGTETASGGSSTAGLPRAAYVIECGSGTYVRSLISDLGDAFCLELRRTAIGPFEVDDAVPPPTRGSTWQEPPLIAIGDALARARE
jgi:tRNA pseudouridine55 synthase